MPSFPRSFPRSFRLLASLALEGALGALAPARCAACDARVRLLAAFCPSCASTIEAGPAGASAAMVYDGAVARAIVRMKYESRPDLARPLADLLWRWVTENVSAPAESWADAVVVPVPLHAARLAERGFNQSALLGARFARHLGADFAPRALVRTRATRQQATLDRASRVANVADAFRAREAGRLSRRTVLLVDDVATTGATLDACARAIRKAGAARVTGFVVAFAAHRVVSSQASAGSSKP